MTIIVGVMTRHCELNDPHMTHFHLQHLDMEASQVFVCSDTEVHVDRTNYSLRTCDSVVDTEFHDPHPTMLWNRSQGLCTGGREVIAREGMKTLLIKRNSPFTSYFEGGPTIDLSTGEVISEESISSAPVSVVNDLEPISFNGDWRMEAISKMFGMIRDEPRLDVVKMIIETAKEILLDRQSDDPASTPTKDAAASPPIIYQMSDLDYWSNRDLSHSDLLEWAWGLLCNINWEKQTSHWQAAMESYRDNYNKWLSH